MPMQSIAIRKGGGRIYQYRAHRQVVIPFKSVSTCLVGFASRPWATRLHELAIVTARPTCSSLVS